MVWPWIYGKACRDTKKGGSTSSHDNYSVGNGRLACTIIEYQACAGSSMFIHFYFVTHPTKFKSARQGSALGGANIRSAENIWSRTNDCEVINNVTESGSRVTCRG